MKTLIATTLMAAVLSAQEPQVTKPTVTGITNFAKLESTIACAGATTVEAIGEVKTLGYKSIINLREASEKDANVEQSAEAAKAAGLKYVHIPMSGANPDPAVADKFLAAIVDPEAQPVFVHCGSGNRAAAMWMIKRMVVDKWDAEKAGAEAAALGLRAAALKQFAIDYAAKKK